MRAMALGSSDSTWKQGEWVFKPKSDSEHNVQIRRHDDIDDAKQAESQFHSDADADPASAGDSINDVISQCWPKDWLPLDFPSARVCAMNYDTGI